MNGTIIERAKSGKFVLIAEIGVNYYDIAKKLQITPMEAAKLMVREAKDAGIHAVKFQTYKAETLAAKESPSYWDTSEEATTSQFELFKKFDSFSYNEYKELAEYCNTLGIEFLSTAFDIESADYLYELMNVYKISSSDLNNLPFVEYQAKKGKPIILSIGASNSDEIDRTIQTIRKHNDQPIILMHCVLEYPTPYSHANLNKIVTLKNMYQDLIIGYSDHTKPDADADVIKTAYNLGAIAVEKHFTLDKTLPGNDHYHAMDPDDAKKIIKGIDFVDSIRGSYELKCLDTELAARHNARRSLVAACNIKVGTKITESMLTFKRPGTGISPSEIKNVIGKIATIDIDEDTILQLNMIK
ncbi:N-acetylneuraminate synthase family protein [Heyndrickxia faecalis]|uniref:N-acetylneuraminate synthase family protein n=1 Tax=Heyndrickxia TaxID=2837504 RepID=UPI001A942822|nr:MULTISPECIES: N-acetylneuraminate synthase family protein [Heyndrickxia]MED4976437.1 N-acetylneuraminate synthase family protein [Weizmannia sp. CD-2023]